MTVDPLAAIRTVLLADPAVAALVTTRIFGGEVPETENSAMPRACIALSPAGGPGDNGFVDVGVNRVDLFSYGATMHEAWLVYIAAYEALKQMPRQRVAGTGGAANVLLHSARPSSKGNLGRDPVKQWPLCLSSWLVTAAEIAAA